MPQVYVRVKPGDQLSVKAGQDVILQGAQVQSQGSVGIEAGRDIQLQAVNTGEQLDASWNKNNTRQSAVTQSVGTSISAQGGDATLLAGRDLVGEAAKLSASDTLKLEVKGNVELGGVIDEQSAHTYEKRKNGLNYYSLDATSQDQSLNRTELQGANVQIKSGGDTRLAGTTINADSLDIQTGGKLILPTTTTQDSEGWNVTHGSSAAVGAKGKGSSDEELHYTQFNVRGQTSIHAQGGIQAQVGQNVDLNNLAQQPGMGWVGQITNDPNLTNSVEWQRVQEAHEQWSYRQSGMGPVSAALVAVMVAAAAAPAASAAGASAGAAAGGTTTLAGTVTAGAVKAGVLALSSQVGVSFFNNNGDLGKVFKELGESDSVKNLAAAIITGGVLAGMGFQVLPDQPNVGSGAKLFGDQMINNLKIQGASTLINTTIKGGSFEDGLKDALLAALVNSIAAATANGIGDVTGEGQPLNTLSNKIAHAIEGCALGAAHSGSAAGCSGGAIGAAMGEMMAEAMLASPGMDAFYSEQDKVYLAGLMGGLAAALAGGNAEQIAAANWSGSNAAANNALGHASKKLMEEARQCAANPSDACTARVLDQAKAQDQKFQKSLETACTGGGASFAQCNIQMSAAASALNDLELMRDIYGRDDPQAKAAYQGLVDRQRTDIANMQGTLEALRAGESPLGTVIGGLAPNFSPADGAHLTGSVAGAVAGVVGGKSPNASAPQGSASAGFETANLQSKLHGYLLDATHPQNQNKAVWFQQALGFDKSNWEGLASQIRFNEAKAVATKTSQYGQTFEQVIPITGTNGKTIDVPFVFMKDSTGTVRFVTGIPAKK